jgi:riboflavin kinase / FMN adenylyltransferase
VIVLREPHAEWSAGPTALTIGVLDGVHLGHRRLLEELQQTAGSLPVGVVTFGNHPAGLTSPEGAPPLICSVDRRLELIEDAGIDVAAVLRFDEALRAMSPEVFVEDLLVGRLGARAVVVGAGFRFGSGLAGDVDVLAALGEKLGFTTRAIPIVGDAEPVSSTAIRSRVASGDVGGAAEMLGRPFQLRGTVSRGDGRGKSIGFPTANLAIDPGLLVPGRGVYAVKAVVDGAARDGVVNVGVRPTFDGTTEVVEVHILDFDADLYDEDVAVEFVERLRDEMRFSGVEQLVEQIGQDVTAARAVLAQGS